MNAQKKEDQRSQVMGFFLFFKCIYFILFIFFVHYLILKRLRH